LEKINRENLISRIPSANFNREIIRAVYGPKIRDIAPDNDEPIKQVLRYVITLIGLKPENFPTDIQKTVLINFIRTDLGHFGLDEIRVAFHMAIKGETGIDATHFQNFSAPYITGVLMAYEKTTRAAAIKKFKQLEQSEMSKQNNLSPVEIKQKSHEFMVDSIIGPWNYYLKTGVITFGILPFGVVYRCLADQLGFLQMTPEQKKDVHVRAIDEVLKRINKPTMDRDKHREMMNLIDRIEKDGIGVVMKDDIISVCHEFSVKDYFQNCKTDGIDLESMVRDWIENDKII